MALAATSGAVAFGPQAVPVGLGHLREVGLHRFEQLRRGGVAADGERRASSLNGMFWLLRISRTAPSTAWKSANWASIVASCRALSGVGQAAMHTLCGARPASRLRQPALRRDLREQLPHFFRQERHHRMQQPQQRVERVGEHALGGGALLRHRKPGLRHLDVEAAELVPGEVVERAGRVGVAVVVEDVGHLLASPSRAARGASGLR